MAEETTEVPGAINIAAQYPTATKIDNGTAYDVSGKALGSVEGQAAEPEQENGDDFFAKLGGKPVSAQSDVKDDDFFAKLGGTPVQSTDPQSVEQAQLNLSDKQLMQRAHDTALQTGPLTVGGAIKQGAGDLNEGFSQNLGRNAPEMWNNIKNWAKKYLGPNATDDVITGATNWIGNQLEDQYGSAGAVAQYSPDTDLGKRAIAAIPMMGPGAASIIDSAQHERYVEAARNAGKYTASLATMTAFPEAKENAASTVKSAYMMDKLEASTAVYNDLQNAHNGRLREFENASKQATKAEQQALDTRRTTPEDTKAIDAADEKASAARANASKAQKALEQVQEARDQHGVKMRQLARQQQGPRTAKKADPRRAKDIAGAHEDFQSMAPPTATGPAAYDADDLSTARTYIEDAHSTKPITSVQDQFDALDSASKSIDAEIDPYLQKYANEPFPDRVNVKMEVADKLAEQDKTSPGFLQKGLNELSKYNITDMSVAEADKLRETLNAENRSIMSKHFPGSIELATKLKTDPEFAANYYALESIRNGLDETLQDHGVEGIRDKRRDQQSIIKVKNAVERQLTRGDQTVRGTGQSGPMRKAAAQFAEKGATLVGAKIGGIKGAVAGDILGEKLGRAISPGDITKDQLAARTMRTRGAGRVRSQMIGGEGTPSVLPIDKLPPVPNTAMTPEDVRYIQREQSPLHAELSTHYPDAYGDDASYENLEKRFKEDIDDKASHGIALEPAEKTLLGKIKQQDFADALKIKQEAAEAAAKGKQVGKATLPENAEPVMHVPGDVPHKMTPAQIMGHEIVHGIVGDNKGIVITEVRSHNHSANMKNGNFASAKVDWEASGLTKPDGNVDWNKVRTRMPDIAATYVAGGVANDMWHNVPFTENLGLGSDLNALHEMMDTVGFTKSEKARIIAIAADDARNVISQPGVQDIVDQHAEVREPRLSDKLHISPERMQQIYQDVKGGANESATGKSSRPNGANDRGTEGHGAGREGQVQAGASEGVRQESEGSPEGKGTSATKPAEPTAATRKPGEPAVSAVTQGGHAGGGVASEEELARPGRFVKIGRGGMPTDQGKTPDFNLAAGEAGYQVRPGGKYELKAGQETPTTKRGVESYARQLHGAAEPASPAMSERLPKKPDDLRVPQERTTGEHDDAIKQGGAVPGGIQKGDPEINIPDLALFHDPLTGSTLALPTDKISPENVKAQLRQSRDMYIAAEDRKAAAVPESPAMSQKDSASHENDMEWQAKYGNPQIAAHEANGGSTFTPEGENLVGKDLHAVGSYPERTLEVDKLTPEVLAKFKKDNVDVLSKGDHAIGTWKDPDTGKAVLDISKTIADRDEAIAAGKAANQKAIYHLGGEGEIPTGGTGEYKPEPLLMEERQSPLKRAFQVEVGYNDQPGRMETISGFSNEDALKAAREQFPDASQWSVKGSETLNPSQGYSVPTGKHLSSPSSSVAGKTAVQSMRHELGHAMIGHKEGMKFNGMLRHTHPDLKGAPIVAAVAWDSKDLFDPATRQIRPEKLPGVIRAMMGGIAADEAFNGIPRNENHNFTHIGNPRADGGQGVRMLHAAGYSQEQAFKILHQAIDDAKQHLTQPGVSSIISENENTREPNLSRQYHYSPERLQLMADEANRRIQSGQLNNGPVGGEGTPGSEANVAGRESGSAEASGQPVQKAAEIKTPESPALSSDRVSTRVPGGKNAKENPLQGEPLTIGRAAVEASPQKLQAKFAQKARNISGVKIPKNITDNGKVFDRFARHIADNLKWVYGKVAPETQIAHAKWYESANKLSQDLADKHGLTQQQTAGIVAAMSPQMDWDSNVSLAKRIVDIYKNHSDKLVTPEMIQKGRDIIAGSRKGKAKTANANLEKLLGPIEGKKIGELRGTQRAAAVRLYDETYNPRQFHRIDPATGSEAELRTNVDGTPTAVPWGSLENISKALSIADDGGRENISQQVGDSHKVRNFYNNIIDPTNPDDVTIDTHAVGAGTLMPLSGNAKEVSDNFGAGGKSMGTGVKGTYPLYAEGYRLAAKELGLKTRELQSVTWEKIRDMFPAEWKTSENLARVKAEWKKYTDGKQSIDDTRDSILEMSEQAKADTTAQRQQAQEKRLQKAENEKNAPLEGKQTSALDFISALRQNKGRVDAGAAVLGGKK